MRKFSVIFFLLFAFASFAQQLPQYTQWMHNQFLLNPAHAGIKPCADVHLIGRTQWVGLDGAPKTAAFTLAAPIDSKRKQYLSARHGLGLKFERDEIAQFSTTRINAAYAAHFNFNKETRLSLGVYAGVVQTGYDPSGSTTTVPDAVALNQGSFLAPDASFGAWYNSTNYYLGFTLQQLIPSQWDPIGENSRYRVHPSLYGGYQMALKENWSVLPCALVKIPPRGPVSVDIQLQMDYNNLVSFGLGYRSGDALLANVQFRIKEKFAIGYSFDFTLSKLLSVSSNTHEVSLRFSTCRSDRTGNVRCPLFE